MKSIKSKFYKMLITKYALIYIVVIYIIIGLTIGVWAVSSQIKENREYCTTFKQEYTSCISHDLGDVNSVCSNYFRSCIERKPNQIVEYVLSFIVYTITWPVFFAIPK